MAIVNGTVNEISAGATRIIEIDYTDDMGDSETLSTLTSVTEQVTSDLTITNDQINTSATTILNRAVAANKSVQYTVSGQQAGTTYTVRVTVVTSASQTFVEDFQFKGI